MQPPILQDYVPPERRLEGQALTQQLTALSGHSVVDAMVASVPGLFMVLNSRRQILAMNDRLLSELGVENAAELRGLRPGEALGCGNAKKGADGCGTSEACHDCGAALAVAACTVRGETVEKSCDITATRDGHRVELCLRVRAAPLSLGADRVILLFVQDITADERRRDLERVFFHDINNIIAALVGSASLLAGMAHGADGDLANEIRLLSERLADEVRIQRTLTQAVSGRVAAGRARCRLGEILTELRAECARHPRGKGERMLWPEVEGIALVTDKVLLVRVLRNMVVNALEASSPMDQVKLWVESDATTIDFCVWNAQAVPETVRPRIFRHIEDPDRPGHGLGTYCMRLLGETVLGGNVSFTTSEAHGTVFRLRVPRS